jgi:hypothetical protein
VGDLGPALSVAFLVLMVGFPLIVFYGVLFGKQPTVIEMRRILAWYQTRWPWPMRTAVGGMLPFGLGGLIALAGRAISGRTATLEGFPGDVGQDLLIIGLGILFVGLWFTLRPPAWGLSAWLRDVLARHEAGLDPAMPPPRTGGRPGGNPRSAKCPVCDPHRGDHRHARLLTAGQRGVRSVLRSGDPRNLRRPPTLTGREAACPDVPIAADVLRGTLRC